MTEGIHKPLCQETILTPLEMVKEFEKGCSHGLPEDCPTCVRAFVDSLTLALLYQDRDKLQSSELAKQEAVELLVLALSNPCYSVEAITKQAITLFNQIEQLLGEEEKP